MDQERKDHIDWCLDSETSDPETQEWRDELTPEEQAYVDRQDGCYEKAIAAMCSAMPTNKPHKASLRNIGSEPFAPKLQEYFEDPCDQAVANAHRVVRIIGQLRARFDTEEVTAIKAIDDECWVFLQDGSLCNAYLTEDGGLHLSRRR